MRRGVVTAADLLSAGVTRDEIDWRVKRRRLIPVHRGVYLVGHPDPAQFALEYAAVRFAGPRAYLSDITAVVLYGSLPTQVDRTIHLSLGERRASPKGLQLHTRNLPPDEVRTIHGDLPITTPARTLPESNLRTGNTVPDLVWRDERVLVELDSRGFHADWIAQRTDRGKDRNRTLQGWTCLRYTPEDVIDRPFEVIAEIAAALTLRG